MLMINRKKGSKLAIGSITHVGNTAVIDFVRTGETAVATPEEVSGARKPGVLGDVRPEFGGEPTLGDLSKQIVDVGQNIVNAIKANRKADRNVPVAEAAVATAPKTREQGKKGQERTEREARPKVDQPEVTGEGEPDELTRHRETIRVEKATTPEERLRTTFDLPKKRKSRRQLIKEAIASAAEQLEWRIDLEIISDSFITDLDKNFVRSVRDKELPSFMKQFLAEKLIEETDRYYAVDHSLSEDMSLVAYFYKLTETKEAPPAEDGKATAEMLAKAAHGTLTDDDRRVLGLPVVEAALAAEAVSETDEEVVQPTTGHRLDDDSVQQALGIKKEWADKLITAGHTTAEKVASLSVEMLMGILGVTKGIINMIQKKAEKVITVEATVVEEPEVIALPGSRTDIEEVQPSLGPIVTALAELEEAQRIGSIMATGGYPPPSELDQLVIAQREIMTRISSQELEALNASGYDTPEKILASENLRLADMEIDRTAEVIAIVKEAVEASRNEPLLIDRVDAAAENGSGEQATERPEIRLDILLGQGIFHGHELAVRTLIKEDFKTAQEVACWDPIDLTKFGLEEPTANDVHSRCWDYLASVGLAEETKKLCEAQSEQEPASQPDA